MYFVTDDVDTLRALVGVFLKAACHDAVHLIGEREFTTLAFWYGASCVVYESLEWLLPGDDKPN